MVTLEWMKVMRKRQAFGLYEIRMDGFFAIVVGVSARSIGQAMHMLYWLSAERTRREARASDKRGTAALTPRFLYDMAKQPRKVLRACGMRGVGRTGGQAVG